jgi:hypothetical protein
VRLRDWLPPRDREAAVSRLDQVEKLAARGDAAALVQRLIECGTACVALAREETGFAREGEEWRRFWTPYPELFRVVQASIVLLRDRALPLLLRAWIEVDCGPLERAVLAGTLALYRSPPLSVIAEQLRRGAGDVEAVQAALSAAETELAAASAQEVAEENARERQFGTMVAALSHESWYERLRATETLGDWGDPRAIPALANLAMDVEVAIRKLGE